MPRGVAAKSTWFRSEWIDTLGGGSKDITCCMSSVSVHWIFQHRAPWFGLLTHLSLWH